MHPAACDHVLDIVQNAFEAGAAEVRLEWVRRGARLEVTVADNGRGMDAATVRKALDPFWTDGAKHPGRTVGLGLPFLKQAAEQCGGEFALESAPGRGTTVRFAFDLCHVDAPPAGDVAGTLAALMAWPGAGELAVRREEDGRAYAVRRSELAAALGGLESAGALALAKVFFASNEDGIGNEVQDGKTDIG
jgi:hypothetical protein